jgi:stearoyl-CoA desaturase (delta-9 desaturase)
MVKVIENRYIRRIQARHFLLFDVVPLASLVLAVIFWQYLGPRPLDIAMFGVLYAATAIGVTVGLHRYFTHRSFATSVVFGRVLAALGMMAVVGPVIAWVGIHRRHHELSDREGDPHSPHLAGSGAVNALRGFYHAQFGWLAGHPFPNPNHYAKDWMRVPWLLAMNRRYMVFVAIGLALPVAVAVAFEPSIQSAAQGLLWGGLLRLCAVHHATASVNSLAHLIGTRPFRTPDHSTNLGILALPTFGESWHNNHHAFQASARFQHRWWEIDLGYWVIVALERTGIVWNVRRPPRDRVDAKRAAGRIARSEL